MNTDKTPFTPDEIAELRRLYDEYAPGNRNKLHLLLASNAPRLLAAAEREGRLREALQEIVSELKGCPHEAEERIGLFRAARIAEAALSETEGQK